MNKICRICLEEGVLSSIFAKNFNISLSEMIEYCCNIKIRKNDGLPEQLCSNCTYKLGIAYHFKQTCESADVRLRQYLGLQIYSKNIDVAVMTDPVRVPSTIFERCKCKLKAVQKKNVSNYKRKPESQKLKRGPKPKPKEDHSCYQCEKQFRCHAQLEMHVRTHTGDKPFVCMYCPKRFSQKHNLTIHVRIHTGEKPFQCDVCSKRFSAQGNLQAHLKIHTGQKDHVCSVCSKSFITSSELTRHMSKHRGVKNFKCDLCASAYIHARDLKSHKIKKHQVIPENKQPPEPYNNSTNIDIIGIDVGKEVPLLPVKEITHHIPHIMNDKDPLRPIPEHSHVIHYDQKGMKDVYQFPNKNINGTHNCAICGEGFEYLTALAQHYLHSHKS